MDTIAEPSTLTTCPDTDAPDTLTFSVWTKVAVDCLREYWPATDTRQLQGIAVELFSDPVSGTLSPRDAVEHWMRYMAPRSAPRSARLR